jgi:hypothetical protein
MMSKQKGWLIFNLITGGVGVLLLVAAFWVSLLLNNHPAFVPNYEKRMAMFKSLNPKPRQGGRWMPRQGENWIF